MIEKLLGARDRPLARDVERRVREVHEGIDQDGERNTRERVVASDGAMTVGVYDPNLIVTTRRG